MRKVWLIALWMALVAIPKSVSSEDLFDPRLSVQGDDRLMEAVRSGRLHRQCALSCNGYFIKRCNQCIEKEKDCQLLKMDDCKLCMKNGKACRAYMEGVIDLLDNLGADVNYPAGCWNGDTPLIEAIKVKDYMKKIKTIGIAKKTGEEKAAYDFVFESDDTKRVAVIRALLGRNADPNLTSCFFGVGALMEAVEMRDLKVTRWLLEAGADSDSNICQRHKGWPDYCFRLSKTPLMEAAKNGDLKMVQLLIEFGANPLLHDRDGQTALRYADKNHHEEVKKFLLDLMIQSQPN